MNKKQRKWVNSMEINKFNMGETIKQSIFARLLKSRDDYTKNSDEYLAVCKAIEQYNKSFYDEATYDNVVELNKRKGELLTACDESDYQNIS